MIFQVTRETEKGTVEHDSLKELRKWTTKDLEKKLECDSPTLECSVYENDTKRLLIIGYIQVHQDCVEK